MGTTDFLFLITAANISKYSLLGTTVAFRTTFLSRASFSLCLICRAFPSVAAAACDLTLIVSSLNLRTANASSLRKLSSAPQKEVFGSDLTPYALFHASALLEVVLSLSRTSLYLFQLVWQNLGCLRLPVLELRLPTCGVEVQQPFSCFMRH